MAIFALSALIVASSSAATTLLAEWLVGGAAVTTELNTETTGELLLEDTKAGVFGERSDVECSGILDGTIGANGTDLTTKVLNLSKEEISETVLSGLPLLCVGVALCANETDVEVWPLHLPWLTTAELMVDGTETFFVDFLESSGAGNPGWYVQCLVGPLTVQDECTSARGVTKLTNEAGGTVDAMFEEAFTELAGLELATCLKGGAKTGVVEGLGLISLVGGGTLTVSSE